MNLMTALSNYWEIEHRPKTNLSKEEFKEMDTLTANWFYACVTIIVFLLSVFSVGLGAML